MKVPFFRLRLTDVEKKEVNDTLTKGWVTSGPKVRLLEEKIRRLTGAKYAAAVASGTAGLHLALETSKLRPGDEIITTPFTMVATIEAILYAGATPVFADIDPVTLNIDASSVEKKVTGKTGAIVSVDIAGCPCDYAKLTRLARRYKIDLIDDAAHSLGAKSKGKPIGSLTDVTVFSFYSTKNITTGEGGMVVSDSKRRIDKIKNLSLHGMTSSGWKRYAGGGWKYDITDLGYKYNMSDLSAALGLGQLKRFGEMQKKRRQLAERYCENLKHLDEYFELPYRGADITHAWHLFIIQLKLNRWRLKRDHVINELEKRGVGCGVHFIPVYRFSYFKKIMPYKPSDFPVCESAYKRIVSLPLYPDLSFKEVDFVCDVLSELAGTFGA